MTQAKIAITLPPEQLARAKLAVRRGRAASVSAYIQSALEHQGREESLEDIVRDLIAAHGEPTPKETAWARRALGRRRKR